MSAPDSSDQPIWVTEAFTEWLKTELLHFAQAPHGMLKEAFAAGYNAGYAEAARRVVIELEKP